MRSVISNLQKLAIQIMKMAYLPISYSIIESNAGSVWQYTSSTNSQLHGLPFTPSSIAFLQVFSGGSVFSSYAMPSFSIFGLQAAPNNFALFFIDDFYADNANIYHTIQAMSFNSGIDDEDSPGDLAIKHYLLRERAGT